MRLQNSRWLALLPVLLLTGLLLSACEEEAVEEYPPGAPSGLAATDLATGGPIKLTWGNVAGATSYNLYWNTIGGVTTADTLILYASTPETFPGTVGTPYFFRVAAINKKGQSGLSNEASATPTAGGGSPPATPTGFSVSSGDGVNVIGWTPVSGAVSYNLYRSTVSPATGGTAIPVTTPVYMDAPVSNGTVYFYAVTAVDAIPLESAPSGELTGSPTALADSTGTALTLVADGTPTPFHLTAFASRYFLLTPGDTTTPLLLRATVPYQDAVSDPNLLVYDDLFTTILASSGIIGGGISEAVYFTPAVTTGHSAQVDNFTDPSNFLVQLTTGAPNGTASGGITVQTDPALVPGTVATGNNYTIPAMGTGVSHYLTFNAPATGYYTLKITGVTGDLGWWLYGQQAGFTLPGSEILACDDWATGGAENCPVFLPAGNVFLEIYSFSAGSAGTLSLLQH